MSLGLLLWACKSLFYTIYSASFDFAELRFCNVTLHSVRARPVGHNGRLRLLQTWHTHHKDALRKKAEAKAEHRAQLVLAITLVLDGEAGADKAASMVKGCTAWQIR